MEAIITNNIANTEITTNVVTQAETGYNVKIILTIKTGYSFEQYGNYIATYNQKTIPGLLATWEHSQISFAFEAIDETPIIILAGTTTTPLNITLSNDLQENCILQYERPRSTYLNLRISIKPNANRKFGATPIQCIYYQANSTQKTITLNGDSEARLASISTGGVNIRRPINLLGTTEPKEAPVPKPAEGGLTSITNNIDSTIIIANNALLDAATNTYKATIVLKVNSMYASMTFVNHNQYEASFDAVKIQGVISKNHETLTFALSEIDSLETPITLRGTLGPNYAVRYAGVNLNGRVNYSFVTTNDTDATFTFEIIQKNEWKFDVNAAIRYTTTSDTIKQTICTYNAEQNVLTVNVDNYRHTNNAIDLYANVITLIPTIDSETYGTINAYHITNDNLKEFASQRFIQKANSEGTDVTYVDLGEYVESVKKIYIDISDGASELIECGPYVTKIIAPHPAKDLYTLNLGTITIDFINNNDVDYQSELKIYLPFVGTQALDTFYIGKTINVIYDINILSGKGAVKLIVDNIICDYFECAITSDIIYKVTSDTPRYIGSVDTAITTSMGLSPFVIEKFYNSIPQPRNPNLERRQIRQFHNYNEFDYFTPADEKPPRMISKELELIIETLQAGVYCPPPTSE